MVAEPINHQKPDKEDEIMVRHASLFSQLIALFNRQRFYELVYRHQSERYAKGFSLGSICGKLFMGISPRQ